MNETLNTIPRDNFDANTELGYEKTFYNELSDCDNESLYIPIVTTLSEESDIPMIADDDAFDHIPKNFPPWGRSHVCGHDAATRIFSCTQWCSSYLWWRSWEKKK